MGIYSLIFGDDIKRNAERSFDFKRAEAYYNAGDYFRLIIYIERHCMQGRLPRSKMALYYPMPKKYYDCVIKYLPAYVKMLTPEERNMFILLVFAIMHQESQFNERARNPDTGAKGLMQILPNTAGPIARRTLGMTHYDLYNYEDNIRIGVTYLSYLLEKYGGLDYLTKNLANWNYGEGNVRHMMRHRQNIPLKQKLKGVRETRTFVNHVEKYLQGYRGLYAGRVGADARVQAEFPKRHRITHVPDIHVAVSRHPHAAKLSAAPKPAAKHVIKAHAKPALARYIPASGKFKVQIGSFENAANARRFAVEFSSAYHINIKDMHLVTAVVGELTCIRVQVWIDDRVKADQFLRDMKNGDYPDAWMLSNNTSTISNPPKK